MLTILKFCITVRYQAAMILIKLFIENDVACVVTRSILTSTLGARPGGHCDMAILDNYSQMSKQSIFAGEMYWAICIQ